MGKAIIIVAVVVVSNVEEGDATVTKAFVCGLVKQLHGQGLNNKNVHKGNSHTGYNIGGLSEED